MAECILVIDTGSSSMRGILYDMSGISIQIFQEKYAMDIGSDGAATMDASVFEISLKKICWEASKIASERGLVIRALSFDSARSSVLAVDRSMRPLSPILMWYDKRCSDLCSSFSGKELREIYSLCGMHLTPISSAPKMLWLKLHEPSVYKNAYKLIGIHDYLLYLAAGCMVTDAGCACRTALMDIRSFCWSDRLIQIFDLDPGKLLPIVRSGSVVGNLKPSFRAETGLPPVPVVSAGGDQQCCILGQGIALPGTVSINSGSASYLTAAADQLILDPKGEVNVSAYFGRCPWALEAANMGSGTLYQWFNRTFYADGGSAYDMSRINAEVTAQPPGCNGLLCIADFAGRGCPDTNPSARGVFYGIGLQHTRGSFARALLEGICYDIYQCIAYMSGLGIPIESILSTGGLTRLSTFNQILADMSERDVLVCQESETTALGACAAALQALGYVSDIPTFLAGIASKPRRYAPDPSAVEVYRKLIQKRKTQF